MKSKQLLCLLFISLAIGCDNKENLNIPTNIVQDINSQKTLHYLDSISQSNMNSKQKATFSLIKASVNEKLGHSLIADTTSLINAATFFDTQKESLKELESLNYLGLAYEQSNQHKKALICYHEALDLAEHCANAYWKSLLHSKIGMIYLIEYDVIKSNIHFKQSIAALKQVNIDKKDIGYQLQVGKTWLHISEPEKALLFFNRVIELISVNDIRYTDLQRNAGVAYLEINESEKAIYCLNKALAYENIPQKIAINKLILMHIYMQQGNKKLAQQYKTDIQSLLPDISNFEINRYFNLLNSEFYTMEANWEQALKSLQESFVNEYNIQKYLNAGTINERLLLYRYGKLEHEHSLFKTQTRKWGIILLFIGIAATLFYWILKRRKIHRVYELERKVEALEKLSNDHQTISAELKEILIRDFEITKRIALFQHLQADKNQSFTDKINHLLSINEKNPFEIEWKKFYCNIDRSFDLFYSRLHTRYPQLVEKELQLCCLTRAGFRTDEIAAVWDQSVFSVQKYRSSIRKKLGTEEGANIIEYIEKENKH